MSIAVLSWVASARAYAAPRARRPHAGWLLPPAEVTGILSDEDAAIADEVLASMQHAEDRARALRDAGVPGTWEELKVRATLDLLQERDSRPAADAGPGVGANVTITAPHTAMDGDFGPPGEVAGFGIIDHDDTRDLIAAAAGHPATRWCVTVLNPDVTAAAHGCGAGSRRWPPGQGPPGSMPLRGLLDFLNIKEFTPVIRGPCQHARAEHRYRPSRKLQHLVRARNATCTAPGCGRCAVSCDLDHTDPHHQGGRTCECNLACSASDNHALDRAGPRARCNQACRKGRHMAAPTRVPVSLSWGGLIPDVPGSFGGAGGLADEALGVSEIGGGQGLGAPGPDGCGPAVVDVGGGVQAKPAVMMLVVVPGEKVLAVRPGGFDRGGPGGEGRPVLSVLYCASEYGLSLETCGRERDWVMPRSASSSATGQEIIEEPRSAWMLSCPRVMPCFAQVAAISFSARTADSRVATYQPTTYRLKMSRITYKW